MATPEPIYHTADMVRALNEANPHWTPRYETVYGELLVTPAPRVWHEVVVLRLVTALTTFLRDDPTWVVFGSLSDLTWGLPDTLVSPDVFVVSRAEAATDSWDRFRTVPLAVEVLSPSSLRADRFTKRRLYQDREVGLYWIVDADAHTVEVWTPDVHFPSVERETLTWQPAPDAAPFVYPLAELFQPL
ncbi:Uma2 family endonuclease [Roseisolibacter agri]|nr:Uma2 family endonuclease [Roseisolibacter agri]